MADDKCSTQEKILILGILLFFSPFLVLFYAGVGVVLGVMGLAEGFHKL